MAGNFDALDDGFDIGRLMPPSEATRAEFDEITATLLSMANRSHLKTISKLFADENDTSIKVDCEQVEVLDPAGNPVVRNSTLKVVCYKGDDYFSLGPGSPSDAPERKLRLEEIIHEITLGLPDSEGKWLKELCYEAQNTEKALLNASVDKLLRESPFHVADIEDYIICESFTNGAAITGFVTVADEEYLKGLAPNHEMRSLVLFMPGGSRYEYGQSKEGVEKLFVSRPGEQVLRKLGSDTPASAKLGYEALSGEIGNPDIRRKHRTDAAASAEASRLGMDKLTDGTLHDFNLALRGSINSGIKTN